MLSCLYSVLHFFERYADNAFLTRRENDNKFQEENEFGTDASVVEMLTSPDWTPYPQF